MGSGQKFLVVGKTCLVCLHLREFRKLPHLVLQKFDVGSDISTCGAFPAPLTPHLALSAPALSPGDFFPDKTFHNLKGHRPGQTGDLLRQAVGEEQWERSG